MRIAKSTKAKRNKEVTQAVVKMWELNSFVVRLTQVLSNLKLALLIILKEMGLWKETTTFSLLVVMLSLNWQNWCTNNIPWHSFRAISWPMLKYDDDMVVTQNFFKICCGTDFSKPFCEPEAQHSTSNENKTFWSLWNSIFWTRNFFL